MPLRRLCLASLACAVVLGTTACATTAPGCAPGERAAMDERLYFGTQRPGGQVSEAEWAGFVDDTIAPAFPAGFTTWPAQGAWRGEDGRTVREASHVLAVVHPADAAAEAAIAAIIAAYQARFDQEAVLRVRAPVCTGL